jgi:hypothetical protein
VTGAFEHLNFGNCFEFRASNFGFDGTSELVAVRCVMFFQKVVDVYIVDIPDGKEPRRISSNHSELAVPDKAGTVFAYI